MTIEEAEKIITENYNKYNLDEDEVFEYTQALEFLIKETNDAECMYMLGDVYYFYNRFDLTIKYWEMSSMSNYSAANGGLGDIYYYGKNGCTDYEKAFYYYSKGSKQENRYCKFMLADMYKYGQYVKPNYEKYKFLIEELYFSIKKEKNFQFITPDIEKRFAEIKKYEGNDNEALKLYLDSAKSYKLLLSYSLYTASLKNLIKVIEEIYKLMPFDYDNFDFFDMSYILTNPAKIIFMYKDKLYKIESFIKNNICVIRFENKLYRNCNDFFTKATINEELLIKICNNFYSFEVLQ